MWLQKDRGTIDMVITRRQLQKECQEQNVDLYMTFVDLTKTSWWTAKFGCPAKFIAMVQQFQDGILAGFQNDGKVSDPFPATNGIKQV